MGKTAIWAILFFYLLPLLNNVQKQWENFASSNVMGWQHCILGQGEFQKNFWKFSKHLVTDCLKFTKRKKSEVLCLLFRKSPICFNDPNYVTVNSVMSIMTANGAKMVQKCHNNVFKLLLSVTCWKKVIASTIWQMLSLG